MTRRSECTNDLKTVQAFMVKRIEERVAKEKSGCVLSQKGLKEAMVGAAVVAMAAIVFQILIRRK